MAAPEVLREYHGASKGQHRDRLRTKQSGKRDSLRYRNSFFQAPGQDVGEPASRFRWLRCYSNHCIFHSLADHSCLRQSSFDGGTPMSHPRGTVSSLEPETPGLREHCCFRRPEGNPCQSGFFSESPFFFLLTIGSRSKPSRP